MAISKVILNGSTIIDLTAIDTTEEEVLLGNTFIKADGEPAIGILQYPIAEETQF